MAKYKLKIEEDLSKLWNRSEEVTIEDAQDVVQKLKRALFEREEAVALAAPQLRKKVRIFCIKFSNGDIRAFINPMITKTEGLHFSRENCLSIPGKEYIVPRNDRIIAIYQTPTGQVEENIFEGVVGEVFQQMVQMLDGVLISDLGLEVFPEFDGASEEEKNAVLEAYLSSLTNLSKEINEDISNDKLLSETRDAIDFMTAVATGKVELEAVAEETPNKEEK